VDPDPLQATVPTFDSGELVDPAQLASLRTRLRTVLARTMGPARVRSDFVTAVSEVAANGLVHGRPPVRVRVWATPDRLLGTVTDQGDGFDDPLAGYVPTRGKDPTGAGVGLWLARQLCDRVETARTPYGFTVRLATSMADPVVGPRGEAASAQLRAAAAQTRAARARARADQAYDRLTRLDARMTELVERHQPESGPDTGPG
jgi:anti-sigma regulatory factor (Ser/Thr protein kinase)